MAPEHAVVLCADDFGLTEGVSRGILELAHMGRLSATSAMTNCPAWASTAPALKALDGRIGVGLHLNLTTGAPLKPMPSFAPGGAFPANGTVVVRALTLRLPQEEIAAEIARQLDAFVAAFGRAPDFVDGHQHVHVLPGIRGALLTLLQERGLQGIWLRDPRDRLGAVLKRRLSREKALVVGGFAAGFGRAARRAGFDTNDGFSGFSPFDQSEEGAVHDLFNRALSHLGPRHLVMCHPGYSDEAPMRFDEIAESRGRELAYLKSDRFADLLRDRGVRLVDRPSRSSA